MWQTESSEEAGQRDKKQEAKGKPALRGRAYAAVFAGAFSGILMRLLPELVQGPWCSGEFYSVGLFMYCAASAACARPEASAKRAFLAAALGAAAFAASVAYQAGKAGCLDSHGHMWSDKEAWAAADAAALMLFAHARGVLRFGRR